MINSYPIRNLQPIEDKVHCKNPVNETQYKGAIESLLYLAINTRPYILFAVYKAVRKLKNPNMKDWINVTTIIR